MNKPVIFIVGPTAVGKSEVASNLAEKINASIISCDSMQVYKEMDIGTSKPSKVQRKQIPHYLIDVVKPDEEFNVAVFKEKVDELIKKIQQGDKIALLVGGSGLYIKVILDGIFNEGRKNENIRKRLKKQAELWVAEYLHKKLKKIDPDSAAIIHPNNVRRIIRALEVYYSLGITLTEAKKKAEGIYDKYRVMIFGLMRKRKELYERINKRVDFMLDKGLVEEAKKIKNKYTLSKTAREALGYKEILAYLEGKYSLDEAKRLIKRNTRRYAKKQLTWFKKESRIKWIDIRENETHARISDRIYRMIKNEI